MVQTLKFQFGILLLSELFVHGFGFWPPSLLHCQIDPHRRLSLRRHVARMHVDDDTRNQAALPTAASMCGISATPSFLEQQKSLVSKAIPGAEPRVDWRQVSDSEPVFPRVMNGVKGSEMPAAQKELGRSGRFRPDWFRVPAPPPPNLETKYGKLKDSLKSLNLHTASIFLSLSS